MNNSYKKMKDRQAKEIYAFPKFWAFDKEQFANGMKELGLDVVETDKICSIDGGGYIRLCDVQKYEDMFKRHDSERKAAIEADKTGDSFIYEMFCAELCANEYAYTGDLEQILDYFGFTADDLKSNKRLAHGFKKAASKVCPVVFR